MPQPLWSQVDSYLADRLAPHDPALAAALQSSADAGLPPISVSAAQGKWLHILARALNARRILEIGTLGGYSAIWLARALPTDGRLVTIEFDPKHAAVARGNVDRAGVGSLVEIRLGKGLDILPQLVGQPPFDLVFIDADKQSMPEYLDWALRLARPGTVIIGDNVIRDGAIIDPACTDERVLGVRRFLDALANNPRVAASALQTVGSKGYDGFAMAVVQ